jgi:hypothetical protein
MPGYNAADYAGLAAVCVLAAVGLWRARAEIRIPLGAMVVVTALLGVYFKLRANGQLFYFKDLGFLGPYVLTLALLGLGRLVAARPHVVAVAGAAGLAAAFVAVPIGAAREVDETYVQAPQEVLQLASWGQHLPSGASIRNDVPPSGWQLWADYMLHDHRLSASTPLGAMFPHPPVGRKADYVLTFRPQPRPADAAGRPVDANDQFELWRMKPSIPGPDISQRGLIWDITKVTF